MTDASDKTYGWAARLTVIMGAAVVVPSLAAMAAALIAAAMVVL